MAMTWEAIECDSDQDERCYHTDATDAANCLASRAQQKYGDNVALEVVWHNPESFDLYAGTKLFAHFSRVNIHEGTATFQ